MWFDGIIGNQFISFIWNISMIQLFYVNVRNITRSVFPRFWLKTLTHIKDGITETRWLRWTISWTKPVTTEAEHGESSWDIWINIHDKICEQYWEKPPVMNQTWQCKIPMDGGFDRKIIDQWSISHCHVWLPEGNVFKKHVHVYGAVSVHIRMWSPSHYFSGL